MECDKSWRSVLLCFQPHGAWLVCGDGLLRGTSEQFGTSLGARLGQQLVRFGSAFDRTWFHTVRTVTHLVCGKVLEMHADQQH